MRLTILLLHGFEVHLSYFRNFDVVTNTVARCCSLLNAFEKCFKGSNSRYIFISMMSINYRNV